MKISEYTEITVVEGQDLVDLSEYIGVGVYQTRSIQVYNLLATIQNLDILEEAGITSNQQLSFTIPANYRIDSIIIKGNAASGNVSVGLSALTKEVVFDQIISNGAEVDCELLQRFFSSVSTQDLYISSDSWGDVDISIKIQKVK